MTKVSKKMRWCWKKRGEGGTLEEVPVAYNFTYLTHFFNVVCKIISVCTLLYALSELVSNNKSIGARDPKMFDRNIYSKNQILVLCMHTLIWLAHFRIGYAYQICNLRKTA